MPPLACQLAVGAAMLGQSPQSRLNLADPAVWPPKFAHIEEKAMGKDREEAQARAEAKFQKQQKVTEEGAKVRAEREAHAQAVDEKTTRLRSLRLAKQAGRAGPWEVVTCNSLSARASRTGYRVTKEGSGPPIV